MRRCLLLITFDACRRRRFRRYARLPLFHAIAAAVFRHDISCFATLLLPPYAYAAVATPCCFRFRCQLFRFSPLPPMIFIRYFMPFFDVSFRAAMIILLMITPFIFAADAATLDAAADDAPCFSLL